MLSFWNREAIEIEVVNMLEDRLGRVTYPLDIDALAARMGVSFTPYRDSSTYEGYLAMNASTDAFTLLTPDYSYVEVHYNLAGYSGTRLAFSKGHELGHIYLDHGSRTDRHAEDEADYFSGYLLAPHPLIQKHGLRGSVARTFGVGSWCADIAIKQLDERLRWGGPAKEHEIRLIRMSTILLEGGGRLGPA